MAMYLPLSIFMFMVKPWRTWPGYVNEIILAIQPTLTFVFLLMKPDVKTYILDLVTLSCLFSSNGTVSDSMASSTLVSNIFQSRKTNFNGHLCL